MLLGGVSRCFYEIQVQKNNKIAIIRTNMEQFKCGTRV